MLPKIKSAVLKNEPGRPPGKKTTLSILRHMLIVEKASETTVFLKRTGKKKIVRKVRQVTLPVGTLAKWLNVPVDRVRCIERNRPGYRLSEENAKIIALQTGVSPEWLIANDVSKPIVNWLGERYTQNDFDDRQKLLSRPDSLDRDLEHARMTVAFNCAKMAAIIARGFERGRVSEYAMKLNQALASVYFDKHEKPTSWPSGFEPAADYSNEQFDITPTLRALENRARQSHREKRGTECAACLGQGVVACPNCIVAVAASPPLNKKGRRPVVITKGDVVKQLLIDGKTGKPVNCNVCKNRRIIPCEKCKNERP